MNKRKSELDTKPESVLNKFSNLSQEELSILLTSRVIHEITELKSLIVNKEVLKKKKPSVKKLALREKMENDDISTIVEFIKGNTSYRTFTKRKFLIGVIVMLITGIRVSNVLLLKVKHVKMLLANKEAVWPTLKNAQTKKIFCTENDLDPLSSVLSMRESMNPLGFNDDSFLIIRTSQNSVQDNQPMSKVKWIHMFNNCLRDCFKSKGRYIRSHSFRITYINSLLRKLPIQEVQKLVCHSNIETTSRYLRYSEDKDKIRNALLRDRFDSDPI